MSILASFHLESPVEILIHGRAAPAPLAFGRPGSFSVRLALPEGHTKEEYSAAMEAWDLDNPGEMERWEQGWKEQCERDLVPYLWTAEELVEELGVADQFWPGTPVERESIEKLYKAWLPKLEELINEIGLDEAMEEPFRCLECSEIVNLFIIPDSSEVEVQILDEGTSDIVTVQLGPENCAHCESDLNTEKGETLKLRHFWPKGWIDYTWELLSDKDRAELRAGRPLNSFEEDDEFFTFSASLEWAKHRRFLGR